MSLARKAIFAATVKVVPPPDTVLHTTAILEKLSTFGHVTHFGVAQPDGEASQVFKSTSASYEVHFNRSQDLKCALKQRDIEVEFDPNHPDPDRVDLFNVFGYQERHYPRAKSFKCTLSAASKVRPHKNPSQQSPKLVRHNGTEALSESLFWGGVPMNLRQGLSFRPIDGQDRAVDSHLVSEALTQDAREPLRVMDLYRETINDQGKDGRLPSDLSIRKRKDELGDASSSLTHSKVGPRR